MTSTPTPAVASPPSTSTPEHLSASTIRVRNPLIPTTVEQRLPTLAKRAEAGVIGDDLAVCLFLGGAGLGTLLGAWVGVATSGVLWGLGSIAVVAPALALGWLPLDAWARRKAKAQQQALSDRWEFQVTGREAGELVTRIIANINALPTGMRADFAPLLATVRQVCAALHEAPGDERLLDMLREREALVVKVYAEYALTEAQHRAREVEDRIAGVLHDGYDMEIVAHVRDALAAYRSDHGLVLP